jgi:hypothetical protein
LSHLIVSSLFLFLLPQASAHMLLPRVINDVKLRRYLLRIGKVVQNGAVGLLWGTWCCDTMLKYPHCCNIVEQTSNRHTTSGAIDRIYSATCNLNYVALPLPSDCTPQPRYPILQWTFCHYISLYTFLMYNYVRNRKHWIEWL